MDTLQLIIFGCDVLGYHIVDSLVHRIVERDETYKKNGSSDSKQEKEDEAETTRDIQLKVMLYDKTILSNSSHEHRLPYFSKYKKSKTLSDSAMCSFFRSQHIPFVEI